MYMLCKNNYFEIVRKGKLSAQRFFFFVAIPSSAYSTLSNIKR